MKVAYFDCFSGISGDMILGTLIDAGVSVDTLKKELKKMPLKGYEIKVKKASRNEIYGTQVEIRHEERVCRKLSDIVSIIENSDLEEEIKSKSKAIFISLADVEAKIHEKPIDEIHFHEVGAIDSIIDIVGTIIGLRELKIEKIYSSPIHVGSGFVECSHGILPIPAPATIELLKSLPIYSMGIKNELVTPTGAAIITKLATKFGEMPSMKIKKVGYGVGKREIKIPNLLRVFIGELVQDLEKDKVKLIETNIDDMNPQFYDYIVEELFKCGAKDVFFTPTHMKRNRPGIILSVISPIDLVEDLTKLIFKHTTSLGVRIIDINEREKLQRKVKKVATQFGEIRVKFGFLGNELVNALPEYEDCKKIAQKKGISIKRVYNQVLNEIEKLKEKI